jgi:hypothetical protein
MRVKFLRTLAIVVVILVVTVLGFNQIYNGTAPSEDEINRIAAMPNAQEGRQAAQALLGRSEQAGNIRNLFYVVMGIEIIGGLVFLKNAWE